MGDIGKEWTRIVQTVQGFGKKHGHWPTRLVLPESTFDALSETFPPDDWKFISNEIQLRTGAERPRAEDDEGDSYIWGESLATRLTFKVDAPEPTWLNLDPLAGASDDAPDALTRALVRLGYTDKYSDPNAAIERAVSRAGSAAVRALSDGAPDGPPGTVSGPLLSLLRVKKVRDVMSARSFRRIQRAVLRVYAAEFVAYFDFPADGGEKASKQSSAWAHELSGALKDKPLSYARLKLLGEQIAGHLQKADTDGAVGNLAELVAWSAAVALDERELGASDPDESAPPQDVHGVAEEALPSDEDQTLDAGHAATDTTAAPPEKSRLTAPANSEES